MRTPEDLLKARESNPLKATKKRIRERKKEKQKAAGVIEPMPFGPPSTVRQIAANRNYYNQVEFYILRSIHGSKW